MQILLISDIHGNYSALQAIEHFFRHTSFDNIINCGDSLVYAPFPNETLSWLKNKGAISILGNTDKKVIKLLQGDTFTKPSSPEKRVMYTWTAEVLSQTNQHHLFSMKKEDSLQCTLKNGVSLRIGIFHGSPAHHHEFLFDTTADARFLELSTITRAEIVLCGHSHTPFHKNIGSTHFINPGSAGRMFDGDPRCSCAVLQLTANDIKVEHFRIAYNIDQTINALRSNRLPQAYEDMYRYGKKTN